MIDIEKALKNGGIDDPITIIKCKYGFEVLKTEAVKFLWMGIFFLLIGKLFLYLFAILMLVPVRVYTGGMHMKTKWGCQLYSFSFMFAAVYLFPLLSLPTYVDFLLLAITIVIVLVAAPIKNPLRPIETKKRYNKIRFRAVLFTLINSIIVIGLLLVFKLYSYFCVGVFVLSLNSLQLIPPYFMNLLKGEHCYEGVDKTGSSI